MAEAKNRNDQEAACKLFLQLHGVVIALAISEAIVRVISSGGGRLDGVGTILRSLPQFVAFIALVVPFFHGVWRHLAGTYDRRLSRRAVLVLLVDFSLLFFQAGLFFAMALEIEHARTFYGVLIVLLVFDVIYALAFPLAMKWADGTPIPSHRPWVFINSGAALALGLMLWILPSDLGFGWSLLPAGIVVVRTVLDYLTGIDFYFKVDRPEAPSASEAVDA